MPYTLQGGKLKEAVEALLDKMVQLGLVKEHEKEGLIDKVSQALEAAYPDGGVPVNVLSNPAQQKKLMGLVMCAAVENTIQGNEKYQKTPELGALFNTDELAKSLFHTSENNSPQAKQKAKEKISNFIMALTPLGPNAKQKADDLADRILEQKERFHSDDHDAEADAGLDSELEAEMAGYAHMKDYMEKEFNYVQAFGSSPDGSPILVATQLSNTMGAVDEASGENNIGYLNEDQNPHNPNVSPEVKHAIEGKKAEFGILDTLVQELTDHKIIPKGNAPTPGPAGTVSH